MKYTEKYLSAEKTFDTDCIIIPSYQHNYSIVTLDSECRHKSRVTEQRSNFTNGR